MMKTEITKGCATTIAPNEELKQIMTTLETTSDRKFEIAFNEVSEKVHQNSINKGFWEDRNKSSIGTITEKLCLMHSELSEALEAVRIGNPMCDKIPEFKAIETELADCVIRIMEFSVAYNLRLAEAILAKHEYNTTRPYNHGKKF